MAKKESQYLKVSRELNCLRALLKVSTIDFDPESEVFGFLLKEYRKRENVIRDADRAIGKGSVTGGNYPPSNCINDFI